jgi:hypothetical protein
LLDGTFRTQRAAAAGVKLSDDHLQRSLRAPHVRAYIDEQVHALLGQGKLRAAGRLVELIDAKSEHVSLDAATTALGIAGIRPAQQPSQVNNTFIDKANIVAGYVVDLTPWSPIIEGEPSAATPAAELTPVEPRRTQWEEQRRAMDPMRGSNLRPV